MIKYLFIATMLLVTNLLEAQIKEVAAREYAATINYQDLNRHLSILASDSLEGRETGKPGQKMAAAYIKNHFKDLGLQGPVNGEAYFQAFNLYLSKRGHSEIVFGNDTLMNLKDFVYWSDSPIARQLVTMHFVGEATEDDLREIDIKEKFVVFRAKGQFTPVLARLADKGAKGALVIAEDSAKMNLIIRYGQYYTANGSLSRTKPKEQGMVSMVTYPAIAAKFFNKSVDEIVIGDKMQVEILGEIDTEIFETENVLGYLEGGAKKEELIVLTAHYDHEGIKDGEIYNGADDDASGTSAILEIAEAFVQAKENGHVPLRSILFMPVTGEEKGLLGSAHYAENPVFPLENTVANLNIDMIGRLDSAHENNREFVYLIGSDRISTQLHEVSTKANAHYTMLDLDYTYNAEDHPDRIYYRSDHWNFAKNGIPIIFYFNGIHKDYHRPSDTIEKIEFDLLKKRTDLVFYTAWELAFMENRLIIDEN